MNFDTERPALVKFPTLSSPAHTRAFTTSWQQSLTHLVRSWDAVMLFLNQILFSSSKEANRPQQKSRSRPFSLACNMLTHGLSKRKAVRSWAKDLRIRPDDSSVQLSADKHTREAELNTERARLNTLEAERGEERGRVAGELARARQAEAQAVQEAGEAARRARDAAAARDVVQERADARWDPSLPSSRAYCMIIGSKERAL